MSCLSYTSSIAKIGRTSGTIPCRTVQTRMYSKFLLLCVVLTIAKGCKGELQQVSSLQFLVTINTTFNDCIATIKTPWIKPSTKGEKIFVGGCDEGPLQFDVLSDNEKSNNMIVSLVFHSSVIEDASPPTCKIPFNGTYLIPSAKEPEMSLLPHCFVMDSREGYHMTYYWFKIFDWTFS